MIAIPTPATPAITPSTGNMPLREMKYSELSTSPISSSPSPRSKRRARCSSASAASSAPLASSWIFLLSSSYFCLLAGVVRQHLFGAVSLRAQQVDHVLAHLGGVQLDPRGLVVRPLVVGSGFVNDRRRVLAVAGDGHYRQQYRENGRHHPDLLPQRVGAVFVFVVDFKFGHSGFPYYRGSVTTDEAFMREALALAGQSAQPGRSAGGRRRRDRWRDCRTRLQRSHRARRPHGPCRDSGHPPGGRARSATTASPAPPCTARWNPA